MNNAGPVRIWNVKTGNELKRFTDGGRNLRDAGIIAMAIAKEGDIWPGRQIAMVTENTAAKCWRRSSVDQPPFVRRSTDLFDRERVLTGEELGLEPDRSELAKSS